jgi:hypothetical protein
MNRSARIVLLGALALAVATAVFAWSLHPQWFQYDSYHYMVLSMQPVAWAGHPLGFGCLLRVLAVLARPFGPGAFAVLFQAWQLACVGVVGLVVQRNLGPLPNSRLGRVVLVALALVTLDLVVPALLYLANGFMTEITSLGILALCAAAFSRAVTRGGRLGWPALLVLSLVGYEVRYQLVVVPLVALAAVAVLGLRTRDILRAHFRAAGVCVVTVLSVAALQERALALVLPTSEYGREQPARYVAASVQCRLRCGVSPFEKTCADEASRTLIEEASCTDLITGSVSLGAVKGERASIGAVLGRVGVRRGTQWLALAPLTYLSEVFHYPDWEGFAFDRHVRSLSAQVDVMQYYGSLFEQGAVDAPSPTFRVLRDAVDDAYRKLGYHWLSATSMLLGLAVAWRARRPISLFLALSSLATFLVLSYLHPQTPFRFLVHIAVPAIMALWIDLFQEHACEEGLFDHFSPTAFRNASLVLFMLGAGRLFGIALHHPLYAYADDGQFQRVGRWFGLTENGALPDGHPEAPVAHYLLDGHLDASNGYLTSDLAFVGPVGWFSRWTGVGLGMQSIGAIRALAITAGMGAVIWSVTRRRPAWGLAVAAAFALVIADPAVGLFVDTLYPDFAAAAFGFATVVALTHLNREELWTRPVLATTAFALLGLALSTDATRFLPIVLVVVSALSWLLTENLSAHRRRATAGLVAIAIGGAIGGGYRNGSVDRAYSNEARTNTWFTVVLPALSDPARAIEKLGLPARCLEAVGRSWYDLGGNGPCPEIAALSTVRALPLLIGEPSALASVLRRGARATRPIVLEGYGQVEHRTFGKLRREPSILAITWAQLIESLPDAVYRLLLWILVLYAPLELAFLAARRKSEARLIESSVLVALLCSASIGSTLIMAALGGTAETTARRFQLGAVAFGPCLVAAVAGLVTRLRAKVDSRGAPSKAPVPATE